MPKRGTERPAGEQVFKIVQPGIIKIRGEPVIVGNTVLKQLQNRKNPEDQVKYQSRDRKIVHRFFHYSPVHFSHSFLS
ncbi:hypothetical protein D3C81_1799090 [compost metagenome]